MTENNARCNEELRQRLIVYRDARDAGAQERGDRFTLRDLGRELGAHHTAVSKYLNGYPEGNVARLESVIEDVLAAWERQRAVGKQEWFQCGPSTAVWAACELVRRTLDCGLIHGDAGIGKTAGLHLYQQGNPSSILIALARWSGSAAGVERALAAAIEMRGWKHQGPRIEYMLGKLRGSARLIMVDNAHRLTESGRAFVFDLHDETMCPVALSGNPEILEAIRGSDQQFSRIGYMREIKVAHAEAARIARAMLERHVDAGHVDTLADLAAEVVGARGHMRALRKHLLLLPEMMEEAKGNARTAFVAAHKRLVSELQLKAEEED